MFLQRRFSSPKKSKNIDYLVQGVNHFDVRASIRAGFNANLLRDPEMSDIVNNLIISIRYIDGYDGTLDQFEDFENYKSYCLRENSVANLNLGSALNRKYESKTSSECFELCGKIAILLIKILQKWLITGLFFE